MSSRTSPAQKLVKYTYSMRNARIFLTVTYSIPTSMFSKDQCRQLNTPIDKVMLNKVHLIRHTPKEILYSSREKTDLNYQSFQIYQDQKRSLTLLKHVRWDDTGNDSHPNCPRPKRVINKGCFYKYFLCRTRLDPPFTKQITCNE